MYICYLVCAVCSYVLFAECFRTLFVLILGVCGISLVLLSGGSYFLGAWFSEYVWRFLVVGWIVGLVFLATAFCFVFECGFYALTVASFVSVVPVIACYLRFSAASGP